ncbi:MAG TPA: 50S ribosomal protein L3 [bacterium]|jgi:large subunit ribosomal protein L3|nr:50S ribosomal protein L3 [bacterium]
MSESVQTLIGKKVGQTTIFEDSGKATHVTVLEIGPCVVIQKKTQEKEGYNALQLGFSEKKEKHTTKALQGHFKKSGATPKRILKEVSVEDAGLFQVGQTLTVENMKDVTWVDVTGVTKGKGFQGVVRRHGFRGGRNSHGSMFHRAPGGIGASSDPSRVYPGTRMPGHMGTDQNTILNLKVVKIDADNNLLFVRGAVPGADGGIVTVRPSVKK